MYFRLGSWIALISATATLIGLFGAVFTTSREKERAAYMADKADRNQQLVLEEAERVRNLEKQVADLRGVNEQVMRSLDEVRRSGKPFSWVNLTPEERQEINQLNKKEDRLDQRLASLEGALSTSPEKAIAVPMLKQELESLQDRTHNDIDAIRGEIGRLFTLTQWFIGLMFTIALGMFGLSFNLHKASPSGPQEKAQ